MFNRSLSWLLPSVLLAALAVVPRISSADEATVADLNTIKNVKPDGVGHVAARAAAERLSKLPASHVAQVLDAMNGETPLVRNWLRVIAGSVADNGDFPQGELKGYLADRSRDADARHLAFQMLTVRDPSSLPELIQGAHTDPSLPLRHLAISRMLAQAEEQVKGGDNAAAIATYKVALAEGRNPDQLKSAAKSLEKLGEPVDLANELAMIRDWWVLGTYDNKDSQHFATAYLPESTYEKLRRLPAGWLKPGAAIRQGEVPENVPAGQVAVRVTSVDELGLVDLNPPLKNAKDAIAYAYAEFVLDAANENPIAAQVRIGCINGNKVWVNGQLVTANEVYHSGTRIDQYTANCELVPGVNSVLVKVCQNAQTESWAQDWRFQLRFTDPAGAALPVTLLTPGPN